MHRVPAFSKPGGWILVFLLLAVILASPWIGPAVEFAIFGPPLSFTNTPFPVQDKTARVGEEVKLIRNACNNTRHDAAVVVRVTLIETVNGAERELSTPDDTPRLSFWPAGCHEQISGPVLPADVPPGRYRFYGESTINTTWGPYVRDWHSEEFEVVH